jgi:hypothetical protein
MENLTYEKYLSNPALRARIEREARQARAEAIQQYIVTPLVKMFSRMLSPERPSPASRAAEGRLTTVWVTVPDAIRESGTTELKRGSTLKLERGRGTVVRVVDGNVWLTQHRDTADYLMRAGDRMVLKGAGITLIHACEDSSLRFVAPGNAWSPPKIKVQWKHRIAVPA